MQILAGRGTEAPAGGQRFLAAVLALLVALATAACTPDADATLADLAAVVPAVAAERGLLLRTGSAGSAMLAASLGLDAVDVVATATTGAPALRILRVADPGAAAMSLRDVGWRAVDLAEGWRVLVRPEQVAGFVGIPAVAVGPGLVAVGSLEELEALAEGAAPLPVAADALQGAAIALVQPAGALSGPVSAAVQAGDLPAFTSVVLAAEEAGEAGVLALQLPGDGAQADAVGLAVRVRTAGPVDGAGRGVLEPVAPLTSGAVVRLDVMWGADPAEVLAGGLGSGLLDFLGR